MAPYADLHVHTANSDGTLTLEEIPAAANAAGVRVVAITDHDRFHPDLRAPVSRRDDVTVIHGIELRVDTGDERVDLLGYGVRRTPSLARELERLQADRIERGRAIIECVEDRFGVDLDLEPRAGIGRPHVARAIEAHPDLEYDFQGSFDHLIGADGPCFVARAVTPFEPGVDLLSAACDLVALAHPFRYADPDGAIDHARELDAIERYYPYGRPVDTARLDRTIREYDLLATGGSDAHGTDLGAAGLARADYDPIAARLGAEG